MCGGIDIFMTDGILRVHLYSWLKVQQYSQERGVCILIAWGTAISMADDTLRL